MTANWRPEVLIRVTPGIEAHTHEYVMTGQEDSKFGFGLSSGAADEAVARLGRQDASVALVGVHVHIGSQIFSLHSFEEALAALAEFFLPLGLDELCVGGGLGAPYVTGEWAPSITDWAATVHRAAEANGLGGPGASDRRTRPRHRGQRRGYVLFGGDHQRDPRRCEPISVSMAA